MIVPPELVQVIGGVVAAAGSAFLGGKNSLNGFKKEVRDNFLGVHTKLDVLTRTDGEHDARISQNLEFIREIMDRRKGEVEVEVERREG